MVDDPGAAGPTIADYISARAEDRRPALIFEDQTWTWEQVVEESRRRAGVLTRLRREGPFHIGVLLENTPEYVFLLFGAALAGATLVGLNSTRRGAELGADIEHCDCEWVITDDAHLALLPASLPASDRVVNVDGGSYGSLVASREWSGVAAEVGPESLYLLIFTSGSTGLPKAVRMSQGRAARTAGEAARGFGPDDVLYCTMPLFHGNALWANLLPGLISGASVVLRRSFSASAFLPDIRRHHCTYFNYVGRVLSYIVAVPETPEDGDNDLRWASEVRLRRRTSPSSPAGLAARSSKATARARTRSSSCRRGVRRRAPWASPSGAWTWPSSIPRAGAEQAVAEFDAVGRLQNPGEAIGEIVGRNTAGTFEGYYRNPEAEASRLRGGWYWTGDLGYCDADGFFYFAGRTADWLRVDGENFSAGSVERILNRYPATSGVAIYGVPDALSGDAVMAAVEVVDPDRFDADLFAGLPGRPARSRVRSGRPASCGPCGRCRPPRPEKWTRRCCGGRLG